MDGKVVAVAGDISEEDVRERVIGRAVEEFGGLDILVNNAGIGAMGRFESATAERLRQVMEVNFFALVETTRAALPHLKEGRRPIVVNVSSSLDYARSLSNILKTFTGEILRSRMLDCL